MSKNTLLGVYFINSSSNINEYLFYTNGETPSTGDNNSSGYGYYDSYIGQPKNKGLIIDTFLNFGHVECMFDTLYGQNHINLFDEMGVERFFNCGETASIGKGTELASAKSYYNVSPITGITDSNALEITSISSVTASFFENAMNLDPEYWDLSYIKIDDEYGLPQIKY